MNPDKKLLWTDALRSDRFKQGIGRLTGITEQGEDKDCCLGVLCKVAVENGVVVEVDRTGPYVSYGGSYSALPFAVMDWAGLDSDDPDLGKQPASVWNDLDEASFSDIADLIDAHL